MRQGIAQASFWWFVAAVLDGHLPDLLPVVE
jgi:hypothetical protein